MRLPFRSIFRSPPRAGSRGALLVVLAVTAALLVTSPLARGHAQGKPEAAAFHAGQVRIYSGRQFLGGGTMVAPDLVLTAGHFIDQGRDPGTLTVRFGTVDDLQDDASNARTVSHLYNPPQGGDAVILQLDHVIPAAGSFIPRIATTEPERGTRATMYGWGQAGHQLNRDVTTISNPLDAEMAAVYREHDPVFAGMFPAGIDPIVINAQGAPGDAGAGMYTQGSVLTGILVWAHPATRAGLPRGASPYIWLIPVFRFAQWINDVIQGNVASSSGTKNDELKRRRLPEQNEGDDLPYLTGPPAMPSCDAGAHCAAPDPVWGLGTLLGSGNNRGTMHGICVNVAENGCSFNGTSYPNGTSTWLTLGPANTPPTGGTREVEVWCTTTDTFAAGGTAQPVLRISFTNHEGASVPPGYGWWDVVPDQVGSGAGGTPIDTSRFSAC